MKTIWMINQYSSTLETGYAGRTYYFAREFAKRGYEVYLISTSFHHLMHTPFDLESNYKLTKIDAINYLCFKTFPYKSAHDKVRVVNWFVFAFRLFRLNKLITEKPDMIFYSSPSMPPFLSAAKLAKKFKCPLVWDVRDLWPLTLTELAGMSQRHPMIKFMQWIEDKACKESNFIISNWPYAINHLESRGALKNKFLWIPNGISENEFYNCEPLSKKVKKILPQDKFVVGYTGTFGDANALDVLIKAAEKLKNFSDIAFVLVGRGKLKESILSQLKIRNLSNVQVLNSIPKKQVPSMLKSFDICYVGFKDNSLYRFGSSLNKLPEYLMSERPIVYASNSSFKPINDAGAGITVPAEDVDSIVKAIIELKSIGEKKRGLLGENGKRHALANYSYAELTNKLEKFVFNL